MSFTDQKPFTVTDKSLKGFTRYGKRFGCSLCSHDFKEGDVARWVYANSTPGLCTGNFFVCPQHDTVDVLDKAKESFREAVNLAKQWGIYGPDWQKEAEKAERMERKLA